MRHRSDRKYAVLYIFTSCMVGMLVLSIAYHIHIFSSYADYIQTDLYIDGEICTLTSWIQYKYRETFIGFKDIFRDSGKEINDDLESLYIYLDTEKIKALDSSLPRSGQNYKKGKLTYNGKNYDAQIRYRGDSAYHWLFNKKSYKIKLQDDDRIKDHKTIQLTNIKNAAIIREYIGTFAAKKMGLLTVHQEFVKVYLNNEYQGIYMYLEPINKSFLEKNAKAAGQVFVGDNVHDDKIIGLPLDLFKSVSTWNYKVLSGSSDSDRKNLDNLLRILAYTKENGEGFYQVSKIINWDYFLRFTAWNTIIHSNHIDFYHNVVLYFDETSGEFIQIPWDAGGFAGYPEVLDWVTNDLFLVLHKNPNFVFEKNAILKRYTSEEHIYDTLKERSNELKNELIQAIYADSFKAKAPMRIPLKNTEFEEYYKKYLAVLDEHSHVADQLDELQVFCDVNNNDLKVLVGGWSTAEISAEDLYNETLASSIYKDSNKNGMLDKEDKRIEKDERILLHSGREYNENSTSLDAGIIEYDFIIVGAKRNPEFKELSFKNAITGEPVEAQLLQDDGNFKLSEFSIHPWQIELEEEEYLRSEINRLRKLQPRFTYSENSIAIPAGVYTINENFIIPKGITTNIRAGAVLKMAPDVSFVSYGKVVAEGTKYAPIKVLAQETDKPFGVFAIVNKGATGSSFNYFEIENGNEAFINGIYFSGMFSAYHADEVLVSNSSFSYSHSDDGLNFKYTNSKVVDSYFYKNSADAIDFDFMSGEISGNVFVENGDDAIDTSGSTTLVKDNYVFASGDKCMSLGENSNVIAINNILNACKIGIECKDSSNSIILNSVIVNNEIGVNSYQKKEIFGGAHCEFYNNVIVSNKKEIAFENSFDEQKLATDDSSVTIEYSLVDYEGHGNLHDSDNYEDLIDKNWMTKGVGQGSLEKLKQHYDEEIEYAPIGLLKTIPNIPTAYE